MGKYQLDSKAQADVGKFHEKYSNSGGKTMNPQQMKKKKIEELRKRVRNGEKNDKEA